jgi:hypothetical protein
MKDKLENYSVRGRNNILAGVFKFQVTACNFMIAINIFLMAKFHHLTLQIHKDPKQGFFYWWIFAKFWPEKYGELPHGR